MTLVRWFVVEVSYIITLQELGVNTTKVKKAQGKEINKES